MRLLQAWERMPPFEWNGPDDAEAGLEETSPDEDVKSGEEAQKVEKDEEATG